MLGMVCLRPNPVPSCVLANELAEGDVPAVAVARARCPPAENALGPVGLANVLFAVRRVRDEIYPLDFRQGSMPVSIARVLHRLA